MNQFCISIRGFNRPHYLKQCLDSLSSNTDLDVDFYFFQDGAVNPFSGIRYATDQEITDSLTVFQESNLPNKTIYQSPVNLGAALRNQYQLDVLFPKYKYVVLADGDLIFNKYYIKTLKVLFKQFENSDVGMLQTSFRHTGTPQLYKKARKLASTITFGFSHFWEMGFWRDKWEKIKPNIEPYFELVKECDFKQLLYNPKVYGNVRKRLYKVYGKYGGGLTTSEDYALSKAVTMAGYKGLHTLTLRHKTIGREGNYSFNGSRWDSEGFDNIKLYNLGNVNKYTLT